MNTFESDKCNNIAAELERLAEMNKLDGKYTDIGLFFQEASGYMRALIEREEYLEDKLCQIEYIVAGALR